MKKKLTVVFALLLAGGVALAQGYGSISSVFDMLKARTLTVTGTNGLIASGLVSNSGSSIITNLTTISYLVSGHIIYNRGPIASTYITNDNGTDPLFVNDLQGLCVGDLTGTTCDGAINGGAINASTSVVGSVINAGSVLINSAVIGTSASGTGYSVESQGAIRTFMHKFTVDRTALTAAATTEDETIWTVPAKTRINNVIFDATAAWDDAAGPISALTIMCGKTAGGAEYLASGSIFTANRLGDAPAELGASINTYFGDIPSFTATTAITCRFTSTGGNLNTLTTGAATVYIEGLVYP